MELNKRQYRWIELALICLALAIGLHAYLTSQYYDLKFGLSSSQSLCNISETFNCDLVSTSSYSSLLGIPMALWGAATNAALFILLLIMRFHITDNTEQTGRYSLWLATFIALVSVVMGFISVTLVESFCLFCIATYILSFITLFALIKAIGLGGYKSLGEDIKDLFGPAKWVAIVFIGIPATAYIGHKGVQDAKGVKRVQEVVQDSLLVWSHGQSYNFDNRGSLVTGPADAKVQIVEFADFRCIHCKQAAPVIKSFVSSTPDVQFTFKPFPLDGNCNPAISQGGDGISCRLSAAAFCGQEVADKGWAVHDWIFDKFGEWRSYSALDSQLEEMSKELGVNWDELKECMESASTKEAIQASAEQGANAKIQGTPTIFLNGKRLPAGQILPVLRSAYQEAKK